MHQDGGGFFIAQGLFPIKISAGPFQFSTEYLSDFSSPLCHPSPPKA